MPTKQSAQSAQSAQPAQPAQPQQAQLHFASRIQPGSTFFDGRSQTEKDAAYHDCAIPLPEALK